MQQRFNVGDAEAGKVSAPPSTVSPASEPPAREKKELLPEERSAIFPLSKQEAPRPDRPGQHTIFDSEVTGRRVKKFEAVPLPAPSHSTDARTQSKKIPADLLASETSADQSFFTGVMPAVVNQRHHRLTVVTAILLLAFVALLILFYFAGKYA